jgi:hypothetical protein
MNYGHRAGSSISFVDSFSDEILLKLEAELENGDLFSYRLYDKMGALIANVDGVSAVPDGIQIRSSEGELLLGVSPEIGSGIVYRLYSRTGALITCSDGMRTQVFGGLLMIGKPGSFVRQTRRLST